MITLSHFIDMLIDRGVEKDDAVEVSSNSRTELLGNHGNKVLL